MASLSLATAFDRARLMRLADGLVVAVAISLPWSTSATGILVVLWLLALIPALEWSDVRRELMTPVGGLPVLLFLLGVAGMAWAEVSLVERWKGLDGFIKILVIPLLIAQFRRSDRGDRVFIGFLIACVALLIASWVVTIWPDLPRGSGDNGVAVKSYIVQSIEFTICAAVLLHVAVDSARAGRRGRAAALAALSVAFLSDIFFIATSRTALVIMPAIVVLYGARRAGWKGLFAAGAIGLALAGALWLSSPYLRQRAGGVITETKQFEGHGKVTSSGERIAYWTKSLHFIKEAPFFGHGTGTITALFRRAAVGQTGVRAEISSNPHDQTFAVAIQLGLLGAGMLWAMWISQLVLFSGPGLVAWVGLVFAVQNLVGSLFNSFVFDFTEGWIYVMGIGVAAGVLQRQRDSVGVRRAEPAAASASRA
jgi:O-antigen ligase